MNASSLPTSTTEEPTVRVHGDSYADVETREDDLAGTSSTHARPLPRQPEEPSDAAGAAADASEGST